MNIAVYESTEQFKPIEMMLNIAEIASEASWLLIGGLMVQVHAGLAGCTSRATEDVDMLIDVMSSTENINGVVKALEKLDFKPQEPGLRNTAFHRMVKDNFIVDVLIADHLPTGKQKAAKVNRWPILETPGGAQAIERKMPIMVKTEKREQQIFIPDLLGALVLKSAAYTNDRRDRQRHLDDGAFLAALITDHATELKRLHGSDKKRLHVLSEALTDDTNSAWLLLSDEMQIRGKDTLRILTQ